MGWVINAIIFLVAAQILPGLHVESFWAALWVAIILTVVGIFVKPVLVLLTLPATVLTFGLFLFVINAITILITSSVVSGFTVDGFSSALALALIMAVVRSIIYN